MREILFRGKCELSGLWNTGSLVKYKDDYGNEEYHIVQTDKGYVVVIPETVGQFTGLTDKNGKRIFEGDRVRVPMHKVGETPNYMTGFVEWINGAFSVTWDDTQFGRHFVGYLENIEIIGNIHDNPEMLSRADMPVSNDVFQPVFQPTTPENFELMHG